MESSLEAPNVTALKTARMLDEAADLFGNIHAACEYMIYSTEPYFHSEHNLCRIKSFMGVISYATNAAYDKFLDYSNDFTDALGFEPPVLYSEVNQQRDIVFSRIRKEEKQDK